MRIKNLRGRGQLGPIKKKLDSFTLETTKNYFIRNFLRNGHLRVKKTVRVGKTAQLGIEMSIYCPNSYLT